MNPRAERQKVPATEASVAATSMLPRVRHVAPQLLVSGLLPVFAYPFVRQHVDSDSAALLVVALLPLADTLFFYAKARRFEPIGMIALTGLVVSILAVVVVHGDATVLKLRGSVASGTFGAACLMSLLARRPLLFHIGRGIASGGEPRRVASFNRLWELPTVPHRFRVATAVWGLTLVVEVVVRCMLAITQSTETYLVASQVVNWSVYAGLMWWTYYFVSSSERVVDQLLGAAQTLGGAPG